MAQFCFRNGPDNFDYQLAGEDLMASTCLKMSGYPGQFEFRFTQGVNGNFPLMSWFVTGTLMSLHQEFQVLNT